MNLGEQYINPSTDQPVQSIYQFETMADQVNVLKKIRTQNPLVHNITNQVVMNNTANALLSIGASPLMAHAFEEIEDILNISSALVINMGTPSEKWVDSMTLAVSDARALNKPIVFDPVGVGASRYRNEVAERVMKAGPPNIVRGNASEIKALAKQESKGKGVDSTEDSESAIEAGKKLSAEYKITVVISGAVDFIITGEKVTKVANGSQLMPKVTGMGCTATAMIGACVGVESDMHIAAVAAMTIMGVAGEIAGKLSKGPGSFQMHFIDTLFIMTEEEFSSSCKVE